MIKSLLIALALVASSTASAETQAEICKKEVTAKIKRIDARMRAGYSAAEGNRLNEMHRKLERIRADCDKNPKGWLTAPDP